MDRIVSSLHPYRASTATFILWIAGGVLMSGNSLAAEAATDDALVVEEVVVTAQRRSESIQDVPFAMHNMTSEDAFVFGIDDMDSIEMVTSGVVLNQFFGYGMPFIRGMGSPLNGVGTEPSVALYIDGVYQPRASLYLPNLTDIESVEILKGPQSILYGRNATAGALIVTTATPDPGLNVDVSATYGNGNRALLKGYVSGGNETVVASLAGYSLTSDGFYTNILTDNDKIDEQDEYGLRGKVVYYPNDKNELMVSVDYSENDSPYGKQFSQIGTNNVLATLFPGACFTGKAHKTCVDQEQRTIDSVHEETSGMTARWRSEFSNFDFSLLGGYRNHKRSGGSDPDASSIPILWFADSGADGEDGEDNDIWSIEALLQSNTDSVISWMFGAVYEETETPYNVLIDAFAAGGFVTSGKMKNTAASVFGELGYRFGQDDRWNAVVGLRYIDEKKQLLDGRTDVYPNGVESGMPLPPIFFPDFSERWKEPVWSASLAYDYSDNGNVYFRFAQGFRSGSFSHTNPAALPVDPESVDSYALGIKTQLAEGRVVANAEIFYYDISDLQMQAFDQTQGAFTTNAGAGEIKGVEFDFQMLLTKDFLMSLNASYVDGEYTDYPSAAVFIPCPDLGIDFPANCVPGDPAGPAGGLTPPDVSGNDMIRSPKFTGALTLQYELPASYGTWIFAGIARYTDDYFFDNVNRLEFDAMTLINASVVLRSINDSWYLKAWLKNATDEKYHNTKEPIQFGDFAHSADPQTYGLTVGYNFRRN